MELEMYSASVNDTKIEEHLEESWINHDDYKKLKQENENYRQELHILRVKLKTNDAMIKDLQDSGETSETYFKEYVQNATAVALAKEEKHKVELEEYQKCIEDLQTNQIETESIIMRMEKEMEIYKDHVNKQRLDVVNDATALHKLELEKLSVLLEMEKEKLTVKENNVQDLLEKLACAEDQCEELRHNLNKTTKDLAEKSKELENSWEYARELAAKLEELEALSMTPASDTCKGNSLFAEVEDRRQILLDKMKMLSIKYNEAKQALDSKTSEIKVLRAQKTAICRKWETDMIDTLQENTDLLNKYKSRIFDLETKLRAETKKNDELEETQSADDNFNYAQSLLITKRKELKELSEKVEKQAMQMLVQEEVNHNISRQLRHWQSKAMYLETQINIIKDQLEAQDKCDSKILLESIKNCTFPDNMNLEKACDDSPITTPCELMPKDILNHEFAEQENSTEVSRKSTVEPSAKEQKEFKFVDFTSDTKNSESKSLKKQVKKHDYPIVVYTMDNEKSCTS